MSTMLASARQRDILARLRREGAVRVPDLAARYGVSDMTIRRDLEALEAQGTARKVHGGAVLPERSAEDVGFQRKRELAGSAKTAIARRAAQMVAPGDSVALSAGTTTWYLARLLADVDGLTALTNSPNVAEALHREEASDQQILLTGGLFRTPSDALTGPVAEASLAGLHVDVLFLGAHGLEPTAGATTPSLAEAQTNRALIAHARRTVVVADHTKWGVVGLASFAPLSAIDLLITDDGLDEDARAEASEHIGEVLGVPADEAPAPVPGADHHDDRETHHEG